MVKSSKSLEEIFSRIRAAQMVLMVMEEGEEAEGDLVMAGEKVTPEHVNFMARHARGVVSVALPERRHMLLQATSDPTSSDTMGMFMYLRNVGRSKIAAESTSANEVSATFIMLHKLPEPA